MARRTRPSRALVLVSLAVYAALAAAILLAPFSVTGGLDAFSAWVRRDLQIAWFGSGWFEFAANVVLFVPLGLLLTLLFAHPWRGVMLALGVSAAAELAQFLIPSREPSLRDVLANVGGAALGAGLAWLVLRRAAASAGSAVPEETTI
ncbi:VanZ family protein [Microbacterium sp. zg.B48]|uniref:VanZ family protein n=1 Tax=Microbacterium sp. zg.B48 TaxID=2969408 RepID=UPI00214CC495|nr:VanZ family protein [Microbacterium sp. zg.B48]MCR2764189.1 VanZ family protein [Microbacterium sp. zg.B48]